MPSLKELVKSYGEMKQIVDDYKKPIEEANKEIKSIMSERGLSNFESGGFKAKYSVSVSEDFDETKLIDVIKDTLEPGELKQLGIIKTKEYVDMEVLENAIYNGIIPASKLQSCKTRKETPRLTITKIKEK